MARITVQHAVKKIGNRFDLVLVASKRAHQIQAGLKESSVPYKKDKPTVVALREIEQGLINNQTFEHDIQEKEKKEISENIWLR